MTKPERTKRTWRKSKAKNQPVSSRQHGATDRANDGDIRSPTGSFYHPAREWPSRKLARRPQPAPATCPSSPAYNRNLDLPSLIPLWPAELIDNSASRTRAIILKLTSALRAERRRGRQGHWTYNLNRHAALKRALQSEREYLQSCEQKPRATKNFVQKKQIQ